MSAARTFACALVVLVHVNIYVRMELETWWPIGLVSVPLFGLAVPTFVLLSGFSTPDTASFKNGFANLNRMKRKVRQLLLPFAFWNVVMLLLVPEENPYEGTEALLYWLTGSWHLYFIFVIVQLLIVSFAFQRFAGERWPAWMLAVAAVATVSFYAWSDVLLWTEPADGGLFEVTTRKLFLPWFAFYALGAWLRYQRDAVRRISGKLSWLAAGAAIAYLGYYLGLLAEQHWIGATPRLQILSTGLPFQILGPIFVLALLYRVDGYQLFRPVMRILARPSRYTYGIYLCHIPILIALVAVAEKLQVPTAHWIAVPVLAGAVWVTSQMVVRQVSNSALPIVPLLSFGTIGQR